ncbi:geranylgeranyl reductase family protein [Microcoleus vaginatus]|uniref:geranylgeranyl reductase family protein n=1 Tax=Microcoleus vaginatus TaxID=119532 RepID=UPI001F6226FA|nr:geranylgeranyl reductase family protein [Microcoleus vaginatus HSN003]
MLDCIIVGAGPAGRTAADRLAKHRRSVLVVEKASLPRNKPCSDDVSGAIAQGLDFDLTPAISMKANKISYTGKMEDLVQVQINSPMWMVQQDVFDDFLIKQAQKTGAKLRHSTEVKGIEFKNSVWEVKTNSEAVSGRYLIAADGAGGPMTKRLGLKEAKLCLSPSLENRSIKGDSVNFDFGTIKKGFIWSFPQADGYSLSIAAMRGDKPKDIKNILADYATKCGADLSVSNVREHPMSLWEGDRKLHSPNSLLAGDAASLADPLSGDDVIRPAIFSGFKAAKASDRALGGADDAKKPYTPFIAPEWNTDMVWASRLAKAFYQFTGAVYRAGLQFLRTTQLMSKILCGELLYAELANRVFQKLMVF